VEAQPRGILALADNDHAGHARDAFQGVFYIDVEVVADEQRIVGAWLAVLRFTRMHSSFAGTLPRFTKDGTSIAPK